MKNIELMEAMEEIRPEYIEAAGKDRLLDRLQNVLTGSSAEEQTTASAAGAVDAADHAAGCSAGKRRRKASGKAWYRAASFWVKAAAAAMVLCVVVPNVSPSAAHAMGSVPVVGSLFRLVTFRNYSYSDEQHSADVTVSGIEADTVAEAQDADTLTASASASEVNDRIAAKTDELIAAFQETLQEDGYSTLDVTTNVITNSPKWYVLELESFEAQADGYTEKEYFVLSHKTGELVTLADLFRDGADYVSILSDNIKDQMRERMKKAPDDRYFLDSADMPEDDFDKISEDQQFYIDPAGALVITFHEGEVAPMYMGTQEFTIPDDVLEPILKTALE